MTSLISYQFQLVIDQTQQTIVSIVYTRSNDRLFICHLPSAWLTYNLSVHTDVFDCSSERFLERYFNRLDDSLQFIFVVFFLPLPRIMSTVKQLTSNPLNRELF